jgi:hypothetical protein
LERIAEKTADQACFYFPGLTVDEEEQFSEFSPGLVDWVFRAARDIPAVDDIIRAYADCLNVDLLESLRADAAPINHLADSIGNRAGQIGLHLILAHFIEVVAGEPLGCTAFYSSGAQAAYVFSGALTIRQYLEQVLPMNNANRIETVKSGVRLDLSEMLVRSVNPELAIEQVLQNAIEHINASDRVYFKDRRGSACCLVAGSSDAMQALRGFLIGADSSLRVGELKRSDGAHLPVYDRAPIEKIIKNVKFRPPRCAVVGCSGEIVEANCADNGKLRSVFLDGIVEPLDTEKVMQSAITRASRLVVIETAFGARILNDDIVREFGKPIYPAEIIIPIAMLV